MGLEDTSVPTPRMCCPECRYVFNRASEVGLEEKKQPKPEDVSLCINCAAILIYIDNNGSLRSATPAEIEELRNSPEWDKIEKAQTYIRQLSKPSISELRKNIKNDPPHQN
jgi:hypothetical protein